MKRILLQVFLLLSIGAFGQKLPGLKFEESEHDFGRVKEEEGSVSHEFRFINNYDSAIRITRVRASCGCTTPAWSREEIGSGEAGFIQAKYNTRNRPGPFRKSLTVYTTAQNRPIVLYIKGYVEARPKSIEEEYRFVSGSLRFKTKMLNMGKVKTTGVPAEKYIEIYNQGEESITFNKNYQAPSHIDLTFIPPVLKGKEKGRIKVGYNAKAKGSLGFHNEQVAFSTDEAGDSVKQINILATIEEYFPPMTSEKLAEAPKLAVDTYVHDFGKVKKGNAVKRDFILTNQGKTSLNIRKISSACDCISISVEKDDIKAGESGTVSISLDTEKLRGRQHKAINIYTNDPRRPTHMIRVSAQVVD